MINVEDLKKKTVISRQDIADLLKSIGEPGAKRTQKFQAVQSLERKNRQNHGVELTLDSYPEY